MDEPRVEEGTLVKGGETPVSITISRALPRGGEKGGLRVRVKTTASVEDFMRSLGTGEHVDVRSQGRSWFPEKDKKLEIWQMNQPVQCDRTCQFDLARSGRPLIGVDPNTGLTSINLSFLRLIGVSEGAGVTFLVDGVYSDIQVAELRDKIIEASRALYVRYMKPLNYTVMLVTQEM